MFQFDEEMLNSVLQEVATMNECSCRKDCSEIKGLEHRLFKLAQMMDESKRLAAEQYNLAEVNINKFFEVNIKFVIFFQKMFYFIMYF